MNKLFALLLVLLLVFSAFVYRESKTMETFGEYESSLGQQTQELQDTLHEKQEELAEKDTEIAELTQSQNELLEVYGVWHARVENLQNLLSD